MSNRVKLKEIVEPDVFEGYLNKMRDRLFSLLCEREEGGKWEKFLDTIFIELLGYAKELNSVHFWVLIGKIASLRYLSYDFFRSTIFECMNLIGKVEP
jgi:hypothetical protein